MVVDFGAYPPLGDFVRGHFGGPERSRLFSMVASMTPPHSLFTRALDDMFAEMDAAGIERAVVRARIVPPRPDPVNPRQVLPAESVTNEEVAEWSRRWPNRFIPVATIRTRDLAAPDTVIGGLASGGVHRAVFLNPGQWSPSLAADDRERLYPLYEQCEAHGLPVIVHAGGNSGPGIDYNTPVPLDHVAADFPRLRIVISHGGWPWVAQSLFIAFRRPNVYLSPDVYLFGFAGSRDYVEAAHTYLQDRLLFSSWYPYLSMVETVQRCKETFSATVFPKVMGANALQLLQLA